MRYSILTAAAAVLAAAGAAQAGFTPIQPATLPELNQMSIFALAYGGTWSAAGNDFNNGAGGFVATRLEDFTTGPLLTGSKMNLDGSNAFVGSGATDAIWSDGTHPIESVAVYSGASQTFGWRDHTNFNAEAGLINNIPAQSGLVNIASTASLSTDFEWFRSGTQSGTAQVFSDQNTNLANGNNTGHLTNDFMVTYFLTNSITGFKGFVLFFEDHPSPGDGDYNDLVVQLTVVPLPPAGWAGLGSLAGVMGVGYVRRRRMAKN